MVRRPHKITITNLIDKGKDSDGNPIIEEISKDLDAKVEISAQFNQGVNYNGVVYCDILDDRFLKGSVRYDGRDYRIVVGYNYQRHCQLWLD
jgi:hypothetical protein